MDPISTAVSIRGTRLAVSKTTRSLFAAGAKLIEKLTDGPVKVAGEMLSDQLYYWQWQNRLRIASKAEKILKKNGVAVQILPKGFFMSFLEKAGNVEESEMQSLWAKLLASAVKSESSRHPLYISILERLTSSDAKLLAEVAKAPGEQWPSANDPAAERLRALGLLNTKVMEQPKKNGQFLVDTDFNHLVLTGLGRQILAAVSIKSKKRSRSSKQ